jgi:putative membrane protein
MVTDHAQMQSEWQGIATRNGLAVNTTLTPHHQAQVTRLERLSGEEFDRAYLSTMLQNHRQMVNRFESTGGSAQSSEVRQLVQRSLPALQQHLALSRRAANQAGIDDETTIAEDRRQEDRERGGRSNIRADAEFIRDVDADNFLEIRLGQLAEKRAREESVKRFARRMVEDHTSLQKQWTSMASNNGMEFKSGMGPRHRDKLQRLEKLSGRAFDREYMTLMVQNHKDYLDYFRKEGRAAKSGPVRRLVDRGIPLLEEHVSQAKRIGARVGADTNTSRAGRVSAREK